MRSIKLATQLLVMVAIAWSANSSAFGELPRCEIIPLPGHQASFRIDGVEKTRWHYGKQYPRPFFFPFNGPSGTSLTRMGHPGAENHDHHRSVWFANAKVEGIDFWSDRTKARIRQQFWYAYDDGDDEAVMASLLVWNDGERNLLEQELVAALRPMANNECALEIQLTVRPAQKLEEVQLNQTNFGFLAVRMAKSISEFFGGGKLTNSAGMVGEPNIFGKPARWMDYSGEVPVGRGPMRKTTTEGITYFDHPENPRYPSSWHVREDGWMGCSFFMHEQLTVTKMKPLRLRYLLHAHGGGYNANKALEVHKQFSKRPGFIVQKSLKKHRQFEVFRGNHPTKSRNFSHNI